MKPVKHIQPAPKSAEKYAPSDLRELITGCIKNQRAYQEVLYKRLHGKLLGLCMRYFQDRDDALAVMNQGFLKIFKNLKSYDFSYDLEGWAYRIVQRTALDAIRDRKRQWQLESMDGKEMNFSVQESAINDLQAQDILKLLRHLPKASRTIFNLYALDGLSHPEIANALQISVGTSKWHLHQARQKLQALITDLKMHEV